MHLRQARRQQSVGREGEDVFARGVMQREIGGEQACDEEQAGEGRQRVAAVLFGEVKQEIAAALLCESLHAIRAGRADHDPDGQEVEQRNRGKRDEGRGGDGALRPARLLAIERGGLDADEARHGKRQDGAEVGPKVVFRLPDFSRKRG